MLQSSIILIVESRANARGFCLQIYVDRYRIDVDHVMIWINGVYQRRRNVDRCVHRSTLINVFTKNFKYDHNWSYSIIYDHHMTIMIDVDFLASTHGRRKINGCRRVCVDLRISILINVDVFFPSLRWRSGEDQTLAEWRRLPRADQHQYWSYMIKMTTNFMINVDQYCRLFLLSGIYQFPHGTITWLIIVDKWW